MIGFWWLSVFVIVSAYTGTFMSFVISPVLDPIPTTFDELKTAVVNGYYTCGTLRTGGADSFFQKAKDGTSKVLNEHMRKHSSYLVDSIKQGILRALKENFVFIEEEDVIAYTAIHLGVHNIIISRDSIVTFPAAFGIRKGFRKKEQINRELSRIHESGIVKKLLEEEHHKSTLLAKPETAGFEPLGIKFFLSPFLLLAFGYLSATVCLVVEILYYNLKERISVLVDTI